MSNASRCGEVRFSCEELHVLERALVELRDHHVGLRTAGAKEYEKQYADRVDLDDLARQTCDSLIYFMDQDSKEIAACEALLERIRAEQ